MSSGSRPGLSVTSHEAAEAAGVSYRMLDYWLRQGMVVIADDPMPGTGHQRHFSTDEVETLKEVVALYRSATTVLETFRSGELWGVVARRKERT